MSNNLRVLRIHSKYDQYFEIRLAEKKDIPMIMNFIRDYWKKDHILATNQAFFEYEFLDGNRVSFVLAIEKETRTLAGLVGYIPYSTGDVSGAMIKVRPDLSVPMLGLELMRRREQLTDYQSLVAVGVNPQTVVPALRRIFKRKVGVMKHAYMLSEDKDYQIAVIREEKNKKREIEYTAYQEINDIEEYAANMDIDKKWTKLPFKSKQYLEKRYFQHPIYHYRKFLVGREPAKALVVAREVCLRQAKILRIVDYVGDIEQISVVAGLSNQLLERENYEYIDFMVGGLPEGVIESSGFHVLTSDDKNIIPNYFEPFVQKNIEVWYEATEDMVVFRADGDGDRPSVI